MHGRGWSQFPDIMARLGLYPDAPKPPCVVGYEVAGEVTALGPSAAGFAVRWLFEPRQRSAGAGFRAAARSRFRARRGAAGHLTDRVPTCRRHGTAARGRD